MKRNGFLIAFVLICALHLIAVLMQFSNIEVFTKPLIVVSLIGHYLLNASVRSFVFILALVFCCLGDSLLLFQSGHELFFLLGLGAFLSGHVFLIITYRQQVGVAPETKSIGTKKIRLAFPVVLAGTGLVVVLLPTLGPLKIPVMGYALVLTLMVLSAIFRMGRTTAMSFWMVVAGALLFMVSDSLLAINKFLNTFPQASFWIMSTYCAALFLIVEGILRNRYSVFGGAE